MSEMAISVRLYAISNLRVFLNNRDGNFGAFVCE